MHPDEKRRTENMLLALGLPNLDDPNLQQCLADLVSLWPGDKQQFFVDLLGECNADERYEMYSAMAPRLGFKPLSYIQCETSIQMRASELISQKRMRVEGKSPRPINIGNQDVELQASATMKCHGCGRKSKFRAETPVQAVIKARKSGWVKMVGLDIESCPKCVKRAKSDPKVLMAVGSA